LWLHAVYANALELDDFHYRGHLGPAVVIVPLAMGEALGATGRDALRAQIIGNELAGRLGWAITAELRHGHQRSYLLRFAAAAAAASLLRLDAGAFARALAIAMTQPEMALHPGEFSPDTKVLSAASSVVEGTRAAYLAAEGLDATVDILEHPAGFYRQFTMHRAVPSPFVQLGEAWSTHALSFKRYSACAYASGAVDAALEVRSQNEFDPGAVDRIEVASSMPALVMERLARPHQPGVLTPVNVQFSILRCVAAALSVGDLRGHHFSAHRFDSMLPDVRRLSASATLLHDWAFTVQQLRGLDDGLNQGRSADMLQFYRTMGAFRDMFGSARPIGPGDLARLLALPAADRRYFVRRWARSFRSHAARALGRRDAGRGPLGDLRRLSFRMGARVTVVLRGGRRLVAERVVPTGMAGDPRRAEVVREKLMAEGAPVIGLARCARLWAAIAASESAPRVDLNRIAANGGEEEADGAGADRRPVRSQSSPA
ncbi:MAG TPA: MmgE/PrpD family protein, partial [Terriglobales bacterium]|nr:MmgE/PrpD family protein [Terriglobales bacterium]